VGRTPQALDDATIRAILLAPPEVSNGDLARRFSCRVERVGVARRRGTKRAIRAAIDLGLIPRLIAERRVYVGRGSSATVVTVPEGEFLLRRATLDGAT
jgi:hypothetical protein